MSAAVIAFPRRKVTPPIGCSALRAIRAITAMQTRWSGTSQEPKVAFFLANMTSTLEYVAENGLERTDWL
jgi:hypothetical protein